MSLPFFKLPSSMTNTSQPPGEILNNIIVLFYQKILSEKLYHIKNNYIQCFISKQKNIKINENF